MIVTIDDREHQTRIKWLQARRDLTVNVERLQVSDYTYGDVGIEFKEISDFINSVTKRYLFRQLSELEENFDKPILVIAGNINDYLTNLRKNIPKYRYMKRPQWEGVAASKRKLFHSTLDSIAKKRRVGVLLFPTETAALEWMHQSITRTYSEGTKKPSGRPILTKKNSDRTPEMEAEDALCALTGVGRGSAKNILKHFGSLKHVINATVEELVEVEGLGKVGAERLVGIFNTQV